MRAWARAYLEWLRAETTSYPQAYLSTFYLVYRKLRFELLTLLSRMGR